MASLEGKVIAVTGAASGMGLCISQIIASRGATVSMADVNEKGLESAIATLGGNGKHIKTVVDVTKSASVDGWIERTIKELGALHGAVNFAGILKADTLLKDESDESWDRMMNINARGVFYCIRAELKYIQKGGSIVSAASVNGFRACPMVGSYIASKHAVVGLTKAAAQENPEVRINCVAPGAVKTPMQDATLDLDAEIADQIQKRFADPKEIGSVVAFLLSDEASFVTGAAWSVDGGWNT